MCNSQQIPIDSLPFLALRVILLPLECLPGDIPCSVPSCQLKSVLLLLSSTVMGGAAFLPLPPAAAAGGAGGGAASTSNPFIVSGGGGGAPPAAAAGGNSTQVDQEWDMFFADRAKTGQK